MWETTMRLHLFCLSALLFASCTGWRLADEVTSSDLHTVSIPFVSGESSGALTQQLALAIEEKSPLKYISSDNGEYILNVRIIDKKKQNIGFRYKPKNLARGKKTVIPSETRKELLVEVTLIESFSGKVLIGPEYIKGSCVFDHQNYSLNSAVNVFSLGQLSDVDTSSDVISIPLFRNLAKKIAEHVTNEWYMKKTEN